MERSLLSMFCQTAPRTFQFNPVALRENRWWHSLSLSHLRPGVFSALFIVTSTLKADWRPVKNMKRWFYVR